jgi:hypothetical protein
MHFFPPAAWEFVGCNSVHDRPTQWEWSGVILHLGGAGVSVAETKGTLGAVLLVALYSLDHGRSVSCSGSATPARGTLSAFPSTNEQAAPDIASVFLAAPSSEAVRSSALVM